MRPPHRSEFLSKRSVLRSHRPKPGTAVLHLSRGEAGIPGTSHQGAADIRTAEAQKAGVALKAKPLFAGQADGRTEVSPARYAAFRRLVAGERPDVLFTRWPVDSHPHHRACSPSGIDVPVYSRNAAWESPWFARSRLVFEKRTSGIVGRATRRSSPVNQCEKASRISQRVFEFLKGTNKKGEPGVATPSSPTCRFALRRINQLPAP
jgi:LmbE family N-acetylglucosaminyl deacetylase